MPACHPLALVAAAVALCAAAAAVPAQRPVVTVGGVNPDYLDLPPAVAAAQPGSIVEVRTGFYTGFATGKALRVVLQGCTIVAPAGAAWAIAIDHVAGADQFVLAGEGTVLPGTIGAMRVGNTAAPVVIEGILFGGGAQQIALDVYNTGTVHVARSILFADPALSVRWSNLILSECILGNDFGPAAVVSNALCEIVRTVMAGDGQPALRVFDSDVRLSSDGSSTMLVLGAPMVPVSAFEAFDSVVEWDPATFVLGPANGAPAFEGVNTNEIVEEVPVLVGGPAPLGGVATARLTTSAASFGLIGIGGLLPSPLVLGPLGVYVEPASTAVGAIGAVGPAGLTFSVALPNSPVLRGELLCLQGSVMQTATTFVLSGPALWYLE